MAVLITIVTSAVVSAIVSGLMTIWGQHLERRSRRDELALSTAVHLATTWTETVVKVYSGGGAYAGPQLGDPGVFFATYYRWVKHLLDKGKLPPDVVVPS